MQKMSKHPNIGKELEHQLEKVGIFCLEDLKKVGSKRAWLDIQSIDHSACIHRLNALEGAIQNTKKLTCHKK